MTQPEISPGSGRQDEVLAIPHLLRTLRRHRWMLLGIMLLSLVAAAVITKISRPLYATETFVRIDDSNAKNNVLGGLAALPGMKQGDIETEMMVLRSRELVTVVVDSLALRVVLDKPVRPRQSILQVISAGTSSLGAVVDFTRSGDGVYSVNVKESKPAVRVPPTVRAGVPFDIGDVKLAILPGANAGSSDIRVRIKPYRDAVRDAREDIVPVRPDQDAKVIKIDYRSTDSMLVAAVPNALTQAFIRYKSVTSHSEETSTVEFLQGQVQEYEKQVADAELRLRDYSQSAQVVAPKEQATLEVTRLAQLQAKRDEVMHERDGLQRLLRIVEDSAATGSTAPYRQLASFPTFFSNKAVQDMLASLTELESQRTQFRLRRTPANEDVRAVDQEIARTENALHTLTRSYLANLSSELGTLNASLASYGTQLAQVPDREMEFARYSRQATLVGNLYSLLQTRLKEAQVRAAIEPGDVRVFDPALVPDEPIAPRPFRNMLLGLFIGIVLGGAAVYIRESSNTVIRSQQEIAEITGDLPFLGFIPRMAAFSRTERQEARSRKRGAKAGAATGRNVVTVHAGAGGVVLDDLADSAAMEAYRALRTNLRYVGNIPDNPVILITSSIPSEGKSTTATNLSRIIALEGLRVLLMDADLRRGHVHDGLGLQKAPGLAHVLTGEKSLQDAVQHVETTTGARLDVLTAGAYPQNAAELLGSPAMRALLEQCRSQYDIVMIDAPPVTAVADAAMLSTRCDAAILIVRTGRTPRHALQYTFNQLQQLRAPLRGVVINDIDQKDDAGYYAYAYTEYSNT